MNRFRRFFPRLILPDTLVFLLAYVLISLLLGRFGLAFRKWVLILFLFLTAAGMIAGVIQLLLKIRKKAVRYGLIGLFAAVLLAAGTAAAPTALFAFAGEEHVVERDGRKYVAHVDGWLDTYVYYYEYKGPFLEGAVKRIEEYYGDGGFDPIGSEHTYPVMSTTYYDEDGNILSTN